MLKLKPLEYICHIISAIIHIAHDDVIKWKLVLRYCPFVWGIHRSPVNSPHKGQWREALMFSLICARINGWVNYDEAGDLRRPRARYDVTVMANILISVKESVVSPPCESYFILYYTITANGISNVLCWHKYWKCEISFLRTQLSCSPMGHYQVKILLWCPIAESPQKTLFHIQPPELEGRPHAPVWSLLQLFKNCFDWLQTNQNTSIFLNIEVNIHNFGLGKPS